MGKHKSDKPTLLRILLVEDDEHDRAAFRRAFKKAPFPSEIQTCVRAEDAMEKLSVAASSVDILVSDFLLPGMNGLELCQELIGKKVNFPLVILTGSGSEHIAVEALKVGIDDYIVKDPEQGYLKLIPYVIRDVVRKYHDRQNREQAEEALRESEERYSLALAATRDGIWDWDLTTDSVVYSHQWKAMLGYEDDEITKHLSEWERLVHPKDQQQALCAVKDYIAGRSTNLIVEMRMRHKNGRWVHILSRGDLIRDRDNRPKRLIGTHVDITERKELEAQLRQARKMESIGTLAGGIAHDFNNILYRITGNADLAMEDTPDWNPVYDNLREIKAAGLKGASIVRQLLNFVQYDTDEEFKPMGAVAVLRDLLHFMRATIPDDIHIRKHLPENEIIICGEPSQFRQAIMNICLNASQAMEAKGGILDIAVHQSELNATEAENLGISHGHYLSVTVRDTGSGIAADVLDRIFDPYFSTKETGHGSGMGLSVAQGIVKNHDGAIVVQSQPEEGTTFTVFFPILSEMPMLREMEDEDILTGRREAILVVDDDESLAKMKGATLERLGYSVTVETDPVGALSLFRMQPTTFDLVVTDMTMPQMTGVTLVGKIKKIRTNIPIIICTGYSEKIDAKKAESIGVKGFLMKPIIKSEMAKTIRKALDEAKDENND